jgi:hypothetical protein
VSDSRDCNDDGKSDRADDGGTDSSKGRSRSSSGGGCSACDGSRAQDSARSGFVACSTALGQQYDTVLLCRGAL